MTQELREKLESLRAIAPRLNKATDDAAAVIKATDAFLDDLGLGVEAYAPFFKHEEYKSEDANERRSTTSHLAYGRINSKFGIHVAYLTNRLEENPYGGDDYETQIEEDGRLWSSCPRDEKLKSFATLPSLLDQILVNAQSLADRAEKAASLVGEMMDSLGQESPTPSKTAALKAGKRRGKKAAEDAFPTWEDVARELANDKAIDDLRNAGSLGVEPVGASGESAIWGKRAKDRNTFAELVQARALLARLGIEELAFASSDDGSVWVIVSGDRGANALNDLMIDPVFV